MNKKQTQIRMYKIWISLVGKVMLYIRGFVKKKVCSWMLSVVQIGVRERFGPRVQNKSAKIKER